MIVSRRRILSAAGAIAASVLATAALQRLVAENVNRASGLTGRVVLPSDPAYDADRHDFNQRFDVLPQAIVYCRTTDDVANAVMWARTQKLPLAVRSGGHSYEGFSLSPGLIIDLSDMNAVVVDPVQERVIAQPGIRLLPLYQLLGSAGLTIAGGTCAGVGLG